MLTFIQGITKSYWHSSENTKIGTQRHCNTERYGMATQAKRVIMMLLMMPLLRLQLLVAVQLQGRGYECQYHDRGVVGLLVM